MTGDPPFPSFAMVQSQPAFDSKRNLSEGSRRVADDLERAIVSDPADGEVRVYDDPASPLEVTFQVDRVKERVLFLRYTERLLRLRKTIFISYSHQDSIWIRELRDVFQILESVGEISFWDDSKILAGQDWQATLEAKLDAANAAILLVSDAFLNSDFVTRVELPRILEDKKKAVYWIHLSRSKVQEKEPRIARFHSLSSDPNVTLADLVGLGSDNLNSELLRIAKTLAGAIRSN
jgi:hypothetical protein